MKLVTFTHVFILLFIFSIVVSPSYAQQCLWAKGMISTGSAGGITNAIGPASSVTDASGNVYITGSYQGDTVTFGSLALMTTDSLLQDMFLAKYDSSGNALWAKSFGSSYDDCFAFDMAMDHSGNEYIVGV